MEFKVNSKELEKLLNRVFPAVPTRTPMPVLENFVFEINDNLLTVSASDLEISLKSSLGVVADGNLSILVPAKLLYDIVRTLHDTTINFEVADHKKLTITTDKGEYILSYTDIGDYPEIPSFPENESFEDDPDYGQISLKSEDLKYALEKTSFAVSKEEMRPAMMGLLFEFTPDGLRFVATDGHRLVNLLLKSAAVENQSRYIVPEKAINVLLKILNEGEFTMNLSKTHISFRLENIELITRLIAHKYPDYSSVIPMENEFKLKVKTSELQSSIKRMMLFSHSNTRRVKFSINSDSIEISAEDIDIGASGREKIFCEYSGEAMEIGFNSQYVNEMLAHSGGEEELIFSLQNPTKAVLVEPVENREDQELLMLLMPVRLNT